MNLGSIDDRLLVAILLVFQEELASDDFERTVWLYTVCGGQNSHFIQNRTAAAVLKRDQRWNAPLNRHLVRKFTWSGIAAISDSGLQRKGAGQTCCRKMWIKSHFIKNLLDFYVFFKDVIFRG